MTGLADYLHLSQDELLQELKKKDLKIAELENKIIEQDASHTHPHMCQEKKSPLDLLAIKRYSRQLILPEIGPRGQVKLRDASVLIVGCGGLGCPAAIYLAGAGVGHLGLVDFDEVEISNLHRQILHTEKKIGMSKAHSVMNSVQSLNSTVKCDPYIVALSSNTIMDIIKGYDIVLDCTDNVATRYLLNDACILVGKPLVSGSALRFDGQLTVYGFQGGPCYRCLFPKPPPSETVTNCSDGGVLGVVPGVIGCLQALETIKLILNTGDSCSKRLLLFDALTLSFRNVKLREGKKSCELCGPSPSIKALIDYEQFCGGKATDKDEGLSLLDPCERITVKKYKKMVDSKVPHLLIDVRAPIEMEICALPHAVNVPLKELDKVKQLIMDLGMKSIVCICRRGNDSQKAVLTLKQELIDVTVKDVVGGLTAWANQIDPHFPVY